MNKLVPVLLAIILCASVIVIHPDFAFAKSKKFDKQVEKAIDKLSHKKHWDDICLVNAVRNDNASTKVDNSKCGPVIPEPPKNQKPVIQPINPIKAVINETVNVNASVSDPDGNITLIVFTQNSGPQASFISSNASFWFIPAVNGTYEFQVKATDNQGASSTEKFTVNVGTINPQPEPCPVGTHREGNTCVPDPNPQPSENVTKVALVGDLSGSSVLNSIKNANVDYAIVLGDYYQSSASGINSYLGQVKQVAPVVNCLLGNHESANEDGNQQVQDASILQCGDHWSFSIGNVGFIGFNSNNLGSAIDIPKNVSSMVILSHKQCLDAHPNNHHPVESSVKAFCESILSKIPSNVKVYWISGHDHTQSENKAGDIFTSGAGGRSHYTCSSSTDPIWWCQNQKYGYLLMSIDSNNGNIDFKFMDTNGNVIH